MKKYNIIKCVLHYHGINYTKDLCRKFPDLIVIDAIGDFKTNLPNEVIKIENKGWSENWKYVINLLWDRDWDYIWMTNNDITIKTNHTYFFDNILKTINHNSNIKILTPCFNTPHKDYFDCNCRFSKWFNYTAKSIEFVSPIISRDVFINIGIFPIETKYGFGWDNYYVFYSRKLGYDIAINYNAQIRHEQGLSAKIEYKSYNNYFNSGVNEYFTKLLPLMVKDGFKK